MADWRDGTGTDMRDNTAHALKTTLIGAAGASIDKAEDAQHTSGDRGYMLLAVRKDTAAALAGTDADYIPLITDASGRLWVNVGALPAGNLGQQTMAASLSTVPANNITDATYIGDIKFGEALPAGTNNIGDVDVASLPGTVADDIGDIKTAVEVLDNAISGSEMQVDVVGALPAGTAVIGATKDAGPSWTSVYTYTTSADMTAAAALTAAPTAGQKIVITDILISSDTAMLFEFETETSATVVGAVRLSADSPVQITPRSGWKLPTADKKLFGDAGVAGNVYVTVFYFSEA